MAGDELRAPFLRTLGDHSLSDHTWAYGIWDGAGGLREWQGLSVFASATAGVYIEH